LDRAEYSNSDIRHYKVTTTRAEIKIGDGPWFDITPGGSCGTVGQPYALSDVPSESYTIRVWGNILTNNSNTEVGRRYFWQNNMVRRDSVENVCWEGDASKSRTAIAQQESWWDSSAGWATGATGSIAANGEPDGNVVNYGHSQTITDTRKQLQKESEVGLDPITSKNSA
jgi:hypothetical protein